MVLTSGWTILEIKTPGCPVEVFPFNLTQWLRQKSRNFGTYSIIKVIITLIPKKQTFDETGRRSQ